MKTSIKIVISFLIIFIVFGHLESCSKYEEGPKFSLRTKHKRLVGKWKLNTVDDYPVLNNVHYNIESNGDVQLTMKIKLDTFSFDSVLVGRWNWEDDMTKLMMKWDNGNDSEVEIKRLTSKEFWFDDASNLRNKCTKK